MRPGWHWGVRPVYSIGDSAGRTALAKAGIREANAQPSEPDHPLVAELTDFLSFCNEVLEGLNVWVETLERYPEAGAVVVSIISSCDSGELSSLARAHVEAFALRASFSRNAPTTGDEGSC
jgi:hypothetical protein